jgi:hypothetical protein
MTMITRNQIQADLQSMLAGRRFVARHGVSYVGRISALHVCYIDRSSADDPQSRGDLSVMLQIQGVRTDSAPGFAEALLAAGDELAREEESNEQRIDSRLRGIDRFKDMARLSYDPADLNAWTFHVESSDGSSAKDCSRKGWATLPNVAPEAEVSLRVADSAISPKPSRQLVSLVRRRPMIATGVLLVLATSFLVILIGYNPFRTAQSQDVAGTGYTNNKDAFPGAIASRGGGAVDDEKTGDLMLSNSDQTKYLGKIPEETTSRGRRAYIHLDQAPNEKWSVTLGGYEDDGRTPKLTRPKPRWGDLRGGSQRYEFFITVDADGDGKLINGRSKSVVGLFTDEELEALQAYSKSMNVPIAEQMAIIGRALARDLVGRNWNFHLDRVISVNAGL